MVKCKPQIVFQLKVLKYLGLLTDHLRFSLAFKQMPRLHLTVLTIRNETWRLWKRQSKF